MKTDVSKFSEFRKYYLSEFEWFDGEEYITFNLVGIDLEKGEAQVAVTDRGKISVITYDLMTDKNGRLSVLRIALCPLGRNGPAALGILIFCHFCLLKFEFWLPVLPLAKQFARHAGSPAIKL